MNILKKSFLFFFMMIISLAFFSKIQPNGGTTFANEQARFPGTAIQTPRAAQTGTPGPRLPSVPQIPKGPKAPESPEGSFGNSGINSPQGPVLNGSQRPIR